MSSVEQHERELVERGYTLITGIVTDEEAGHTLSKFGDLLPQYDGKLRYQVTADPGFEERAFSKSINGIPWHVDAPSWEPPPARMALHCHRQSTCGRGHTDLADMRLFVAELSDSDRTVVYERDVPWIDRNTLTGVNRPIVEPLSGGREIIRWRQSLLKGNSDKRLLTSSDHNLPLGDFGLRLDQLSEEFFRACGIPVLIPEHSILLWDNQRMAHGRGPYSDPRRLMTRYWMADLGSTAATGLRSQAEAPRPEPAALS